MQSYLVQSCRGGISKYENTGVYGAAKLTSGLDIRKRIDSITCQQGLVEETGVTLTALMRWIIPSYTGKTYGITADGKIYERDPSAKTWALKYTDTNGDIIGAEEWACSNGKTYLFWATATRLNCKELPGNATWASDVNASVVVGATTYTYPKTNLTSATWHTMKKVNGVLLICNKNTLAMVGYDGSYTNNALDMIPGNNSKCIVDRGLDAVVGTYPTVGEASTLFKWDELSLSWNDRKVVHTPAINAMVDAEFPLMQVGTNGYIFTSDTDRAVVPMFQFPGGGQVYPDGVDVDTSLALFGVYGAAAGYNGIYSYGRKDLGHQPVLNLEYPFECTEIGSVKKVGSDVIFSYKLISGETTTYGIKRIDTTTKGIGTYESLDLLQPAAFGNRKATWNKVVLTTAPLPTSCSIQLWYRLDKVGAWKLSNLPGDGTATYQTFDTVGGQEAIFFVGDKGKSFEYKVVLTPSANTTPEIYKAEVFFE